MATKNLKPYATLKAKIREYEDKDGNTKSVYQEIGTLFASPHFSNMVIKLDTVPVGQWNGWVNIYPKEKTEPIKANTNEDII